MGENLFLEAGSSACGFRENTLVSFQQAATTGASFIEFDVQVTRDGVPVIWHDDHVLTTVTGTHSSSSSSSTNGSSSSTSSSSFETRLVSDLTLAEFKDLLSTPSMLLRNFKGADGNRVGVNPWLASHEDQLPTLTEVFAGLPSSVGFNIEVKMATPDDVMRTPAVEVERVVSSILQVVSQCTMDGQRTIVFSSFDPEVCAALRERLPPRFPVLFLSGIGAYEHVDARRTTLAAAVEFAASAGLQGVVLETGRLRQQDWEVATVRAAGLQVYTYGRQNSDAEWLRRQYFLGVQGAIVDDVPGVVAALTASSLSM